MNHHQHVLAQSTARFSSDTQVLTTGGWKFIPNLLPYDKVAQATDGFLEFVTPIEISSFHYDGLMHQIRDFHGKMNLEITEGSPLWILKRGKPTIIPIEKFPKAGSTMHRAIRSYPLTGEECHLTPLERLNIAFQADGSYLSKGTYAVRFSFSKQRKIDRLCWLAELAGYTYKVYALADLRVEIHVHVPKNLMHKHFDWVEVHSKGGEWCKEFIEELSHWDSHIRNPNRIIFSTTTRPVSDIVEQIAFLAGYGCLITRTEDNRKEIFKDVFVASIVKDASNGGQGLSHSMRQYSGIVSSIAVQSGMLLTKNTRGTAIAVSNIV